MFATDLSVTEDIHVLLLQSSHELTATTVYNELAPPIHPSHVFQRFTQVAAVTAAVTVAFAPPLRWALWPPGEVPQAKPTKAVGHRAGLADRRFRNGVVSDRPVPAKHSRHRGGVSRCKKLASVSRCRCTKLPVAFQPCSWRPCPTELGEGPVLLAGVLSPGREHSLCRLCGQLPVVCVGPHSARCLAGHCHRFHSRCSATAMRTRLKRMAKTIRFSPWWGFSVPHLHPAWEHSLPPGWAGGSPSWQPFPLLVCRPGWARLAAGGDGAGERWRIDLHSCKAKLCATCAAS